MLAGILIKALIIKRKEFSTVLYPCGLWKVVELLKIKRNGNNVLKYNKTVKHDSNHTTLYKRGIGPCHVVLRLIRCI